MSVKICTKQIESLVRRDSYERQGDFQSASNEKLDQAEICFDCDEICHEKTNMYFITNQTRNHRRVTK